MSTTMEIAASGLSAFATSEAVTANNVANINTDGFKASRAEFSEMPGGGVQVADIYTPSGTEPSFASYGPDGQASGVGAAPAEPSNVDMTREMPRMAMDQRAFEANIAAIRTSDEMAGTLLDMKV